MNKDTSNQYKLLDISQDYSNISNNSLREDIVEPEVLELTVIDGVTGTLAVTGTIIAAISSTNPVGLTIGTIALVISIILPLIFKAMEDEKNLFDNLMIDAEQITDKVISKVVQQNAEVQLESLKSVLNIYDSRLDAWSKDRDNPYLTKELFDTILTANSQFQSSMPHFKVKDYEIALLPVYAQAANLHLMLLRERLIIGKEKNMDKALYELYYMEMVSLTNKYINHCVMWYWNGLEDIKENPNKNWVDLNKYIRNMHVFVLDIISLFLLYDPIIYDKPVAVQALTRTLYSDPVNYESVIFDGENLTPPKKLFSRLESITCYTSEDDEYLTGHLNRFRKSDKKIFKKSYGDDTDNTEVMYFQDDNGHKNVNNIEILSNTLNGKPTSIREMKFFYNDGELTYNSIPTNESTKNYYKTSVGIGHIENKNSNYILSDMILSAVTINNNYKDKVRVYLFGGTHQSIRLNNNIVFMKKGHPTITQIPVVKASNLLNMYDLTLSIVEGPGFTGGDVILSKINVTKLNPEYDEIPQGIITIPVHFKFKQEHKFKIRIYYACNNDISEIFLIMKTNVQSDIVVEFNPELTFTGSHSNDAFHFQNYKYIDSSTEITLLPDDEEVIMQLKIPYEAKTIINKGDQLLIIDKIEFIPIS
ncbi:insecticidal delta-endotoxin Cry8Ea1 family protein [Clostridium sp. Marseille-Q2269]|uniref:insecticidal delta-endotoxin Cry8Ea1 family protein n=1 Tax=Clostridium sp. Marseille-Q2269 TaxID=2942205 RepID=UPI002073B642|nr:insecticidal delta-endotoxin Cry8Ea1 family protein [Clostridium sp. Marseille-Q2269]